MSRLTLEGMRAQRGPRAIGPLDLAIEDGEAVVLLGPSGCGKTTTLRCIAGLDPITGGRILMDGKPISVPGTTLAPERREMGMVFQSPALWPHLSVFDTLAFGLKLQKLPREDIETRIASVLDLVGLAGCAPHAVHSLSGGQMQRVALARAVVLRPRVLLFDEPLSHLDPPTREQLRTELRQLQRRLGITSLHVTHDQQEAMALADRIVLMQGGTIVQIGTPRELYRTPKSSFAAQFLGLANLLTGTVIEASETTTVRTDGGLLLTTSQTSFEIGETVQIILRPEEIAVSLGAPQGANQYRAVVDSILFLGHVADLMLSVGETRLRAQISPARDVEPGSQVMISIEPDGFALLGAASRQSLIAG